MKFVLGLRRGLCPAALTSLLAGPALGAVEFTSSKITTTYADGGARTFEPAAMEAESFEQFKQSSRSADFGFVLVVPEPVTGRGYPAALVIIGPSSELRLRTDQSVGSWRFVGRYKVQLCARPLHGPGQVCNIYGLPE